MPGQFALYGSPIATAVDRVRLTLAEGQFTDFDFVQLNLWKQEHKTAEFLERHPHGRVPVLTTPEGVNIYESRAIARYLTARYNFPLVPPASDLLATARFEQAVSSEASYFDSPSGKLAAQSFIFPLFGKKPNEAIVAEAREELAAYFDICESQFAKHGNKFMAGDLFTLADIFYVPLIARMVERGNGDLIEKRPNMKAWWERCLARPATGKFVEGIKFDEMYKAIQSQRASM
ncbi:hypothetical protein FQN57_000243 [Myotisia sp. PD_48]|nr:hypothetical protein FQN57_000243 [Myotisia sp. PD_48]